MRQSTSWHGLNGDFRLSKPAKLAYLALNTLRNETGGGGNVAVERFTPATLPQISGTPSPSRLLCEAFIASYDWSAARAALGSLSVHEMGCGSGRAAMLIEAAAGPITYRGVDIKENKAWASAEASRSFLAFDGVSFAATIPDGANVFFTQSSAEHIPDDRAYFESVARFIVDQGRSALQMHLVPAARSLKLYLFHGVRQYPRASLARIAGFQPTGSRVRAISLGGPACAKLHWDWITWPLLRRGVDRRDMEPDRYRTELAHAVERDRMADPADAIFWAFVIETSLR